MGCAPSYHLHIIRPSSHHQECIHDFIHRVYGRRALSHRSGAFIGATGSTTVTIDRTLMHTMAMEGNWKMQPITAWDGPTITIRDSTFDTSMNGVIYNPRSTLFVSGTTFRNIQVTTLTLASYGSASFGR